MRFGTPRLWSWLSGGLLAALMAIQLVPYGQSQTNPPTVAEPAWDSPATRALAKQACFDCHSNETYWPPYARIAPASWLIQRDVVEGRAALNFSEWNRPQEEAKEAGEATQEGEMPPVAYRLMHSHARLTPADRILLAQGLAKTLGTAPAADGGDEYGER